MLDLSNFDINRVKDFYENNQKTVRMAGLILVLGLAILFFWIQGDQRTISVETAADGQEAEITTEEGGEEETARGTYPVYVDISGEVANPGVYKVTQDTRLFEVIDMAGGLTEDADTNSLNRAERVTDGQKIIVLSRTESHGDNDKGQGEASSFTDDPDDERVDINTADLSQLQTLPGIGPAKAQSIIDYREQNGYFTKIEDLLDVTGIGQQTFTSIRERIRV